MSFTNPDFPAGEFSEVDFSTNARKQLIETLRLCPSILRERVNGLTNEQLETKYRNWSIRQIVHHVADSHVNSYIRFKWTLTESSPTIKAYEEADWVALPDSATGDIEPALRLLEGLHEKWVQVLESMTREQFDRSFIHPQSGDTVSLWHAMNYYPWHGQHHTAQIEWVLNNRNS